VPGAPAPSHSSGVILRRKRVDETLPPVPWESLLVVANGQDTKRAKPGARVDRAKLHQIDLHWHDLRHEGACRLLADGVDIRIIQLMLGTRACSRRSAT
jgi:integrase